MLQGLMYSSGGWWWHVRALRYRSALWAPFQAAVRDWLSVWEPTQRKLLLVGPSAGHTLPLDLLQKRFDHIVACEPDPLARYWLQRRLRSIRYVSVPRLDATGIARLAHDHPDTAILFCNVLGQIPTPAAGWLDALAPLAGHDWASFHDLLSTARPPDRIALSAGDETCLDEIAAHYWQGGVLELTDHQTFGLGDPPTRSHTLWRLTPRQWHVIGWSSHGASVIPARGAPDRNDHGPTNA